MLESNKAFNVPDEERRGLSPLGSRVLASVPCQGKVPYPYCKVTID